MTKSNNISGHHKPCVLDENTKSQSKDCHALCHLPDTGCSDTAHPCLISSRQNQKQSVLKSPAKNCLCNGINPPTQDLQTRKGTMADAKTVTKV